MAQHDTKWENTINEASELYQRIAALEAENARLREACQKAREWLNRVGANSPVIFGGEAELDEQLRAALGGAK